MASLFDPGVHRGGRPARDPAGQRDAVAAWHRRKTEIYLGLVANGAVPPRPGIARLVAVALDAGWLVAVASTSAQASVQATLERAVGPGRARSVRVFAGDIVRPRSPTRTSTSSPWASSA